MKEGMINEEIILFENKKQEMQLQLDQLKFGSRSREINLYHPKNLLILNILMKSTLKIQMKIIIIS